MAAGTLLGLGHRNREYVDRVFDILLVSSSHNRIPSVPH